MSLKAFHIVFITSAVLMDLGFGILSFRNYIAESSPMYLGLGLLSFVFGIALLCYGAWFLQELKKLK